MSDDILSNLYRRYHQLVVLETQLSKLYGWTDDTNLLPSAVQRRELDTLQLLKNAMPEHEPIYQCYRAWWDGWTITGWRFED